MLTREEAEMLNNAITGWLSKKDCRCEFHWGHIRQKINELTEKPKTEIKVGDIYKNNEGNIVEITDIDNPDDEDFPILGKIGRDYECYTREGFFDDNGSCYRLNLDLSKKYKIVEVEVE